MKNKNNQHILQENRHILKSERFLVKTHCIAWLGQFVRLRLKTKFGKPRGTTEIFPHNLPVTYGIN